MTNKEAILNMIKGDDFYPEEQNQIEKLIRKIYKKDYKKYVSTKQMLNKEYTSYDIVDAFFQKYL